MGAVLLGRWEPGSDPWHAARANGLGGSEIAAVLGLSPFESRFSLWHRKAGAVGPVEETPEMEWGKRLEGAIAKKFLDQHPEHAAVRTGTFRHAERHWQIANPDKLLVHEDDDPVEDPDLGYVPTSLLETKLSLFGDGWGEAGTDQVPIHVRIQVLWYLDTFGLNRGHVAVLIGAHDYREYVIDHDPVEARQLRDAATEFLADLAADRRPDIDEHTATYQVIKEMHPEIDGGDVELSPAVAQAYIDAKTAEKTAEAVARQATAVVADEMGDAHRALCDGRTIATRRVKGEGLPYVQIARGLTDTADTEARTLVGATTGPAATGADRFNLRHGESEF